MTCLWWVCALPPFPCWCFPDRQPGSPESFSPSSSICSLCGLEVCGCLSAVPVAFPWLVNSLSMACFLFPLRQIYLLLHEPLSLNTAPGVGCSVSVFVSRWLISLPLISPPTLSVWLLALVFHSKLQSVCISVDSFSAGFSWSMLYCIQQLPLFSHHM